MSQRSATVLGVYNRTLYIERSVVSTANSYVLKSAYGKATAKRMAKRMAKSGLMTQILLRKSPQNTLRANIKKRWLFVRGIVRIATWVRRQAYGCYTGDFIGLKGSVKLRLQPIF